MSSPEFSPHLPLEVSGDDDVVAELAGVEDPLDLAAKALSKLRASGLSPVEYLQAYPGVSEPDHPPAPLIPEDNVVVLSDYRHEHYEQQPPVRPIRKATIAKDDTPTVRIKLSPAAEIRLLKQAKGGDVSATDQLCRHYLPFVRQFANYYGRGPSFVDDLVQAGLIALGSAATRYDARDSRGASFKSYAAHRVKGAMLDEIRSQVGGFVSRKDYQELRDIAAIDNPAERNQRLHEFVTESAKGAKGGGFVAATSLLDKNGTLIINPASIEELLYENSDMEVNNRMEPRAPDDVFSEVVAIQGLEKTRELLMKLPANQRFVIEAYYGLQEDPQPGHKTLRTIGDELGVTESRVSQMHGYGISNLRKILKGEALTANRNRLKISKARMHREGEVEFLERVYGHIKRYDATELSNEEVDTFIELLPAGWQSKQVSLKGKRYTLLKRFTPLRQALDSTKYKNDRRAAGWQDEHFALLVERPAVDDIGAIIHIERELAESMEYPVNKDVKARLTPRELAVISLLHETNGSITLALNIAESTVRTLMHNSMQSLGLDMNQSSKLAIIAASAGLLPLDEIPVGRTKSLSRTERETLLKYYKLSSYEETAASLGVSVSTIRTHLHNAYSRLGCATRRQAFLMAFRDGLIPPPDLSKYSA